MASDDARRPVPVWLQGGTCVCGAGSLPLSNGARLAARGDAVVVTLNYRLGHFGFLRGGLAFRQTLEAADSVIATEAWRSNEAHEGDILVHALC